VLALQASSLVRRLFHTLPHFRQFIADAGFPSPAQQALVYFANVVFTHVRSIYRIKRPNDFDEFPGIFI